MGNTKRRILCKNCCVLETHTIEEGEKFGVEYIVFKPEKRYLIRDNENVSWDYIMKNIKKFQDYYVPKFGKYEIEEFVSYFMKEALFITKDITNLFNMELLCDDLPYNVTRVSTETIKERLLKCFEVVERKEKTIYLKFKWEVLI